MFDPIRRKWVALTPEEWVRQHFINHLMHDLGCPPSLMAVEHPLDLNGLAQRADIVVYGRNGAPMLLVECKAPGVAVTQRTFDQAARYNSVFKVPYLFVTNGIDHYACRIHFDRAAVDFLHHLPGHSEMEASTTE